MDRLREIEVFVAVAEAGNFAKAGERLRLSPPAVTRAVSSLEDRLGARVFNRTTRSVAITDAGRAFLERAKHILSELDEAEKEAAGETAMPQGQLSLTASVTFGRTALAPIVCDFLRSHPRVTASLMLVDRVVNLSEEGVDVAIRIGELPDSSLIAKRVGAVRRVLVASPEYLIRRGVPAQPTDLKVHSMIAFTGLLATREWRFGNEQNPTTIAINPTLEINDAQAAINAAEMGHGMTVALSYMTHDRIRQGRLVEVLAAFAPPPRPVHLVYAQTRLLAPKTRAFVDFAAPRLKNLLGQYQETEAEQHGSRRLDVAFEAI